ncbi:hypothetical protein LX36DRAFT_716509 [Colletotrichum falcatum]|nr:hypothetical protein LX36DRAFT_716509 [Colletotrichum falcatum]
MKQDQLRVFQAPEQWCLWSEMDVFLSSDSFAFDDLQTHGLQNREVTTLEPNVLQQTAELMVTNVPPPSTSPIPDAGLALGFGWHMNLTADQRFIQSNQPTLTSNLIG